MSMNKIKVVFEAQECKEDDVVMNNALLTSLMIAVARVGLQNLDSQNYDKIKKEN